MKYFFILLITSLFVSCNWAKKKSEETVNKAGEVVAQTGSEFVNGIKKGVDKTFQNKIVFSDQLKNEGLSAGRIIINSSDSATDNIITAYLIFNQDIDQKITVKVFDENNEEYGRATKNIKAQKGEAKYIDFIFDKRTNIDGKGKLVFG